MNPDPDPSLRPRMGDPDVDVMLAFQAGDDESFRDLVERHSQALLNWFWYQTRDHGLAEDLTQEVWQKVYRYREDYEPRARFSTYLFRVARNHWIDRYRRDARRPNEISLDDDEGDGEGDSLVHRLSAEPADPESGLRREDLARELSQALERLPEPMREVFLLGELEGLSYSTVAEVLEIPVGTVKSRMFHAVRRLQALLGASPS